MSTKKDLHKLVVELPQGELKAAARYLMYLQGANDPLWQALLEAPEEREQLNRDTRSALDLARRQAKKGKGRPWQEVRKELAGA
jgi:hypothetical protein